MHCSNPDHICTMRTSAWYTLHQMHQNPHYLCSQYHAPPLHGTLCITCTVATPTTCVKSVPCTTSAWCTLHQMHRNNPDHVCIVSTMRHLCMVHSAPNAPQQPRPLVYCQYHAPALHGTLCIRCTVATPTSCVLSVQSPPLYGTLCISCTVATATTCVWSVPSPCPPLHGTLNTR